MTTAQIVDRILRSCNDVSRADALLVANERQRTLVAAAEYLEKTITAFATTVIGQSTYLAADQDLTDLKALFVGDSRDYYRATAEELRLLRNGNLRLSNKYPGAFADYFDTTGVWGVEIFPTPTVAGTSISARVIDDPPDMVEAGQGPAIPKQFHPYIAYGAIAEFLATDDLRLSEADRFESMFSQGAQALKRAKLKRTDQATQIRVRGYHT